jgi:hypothetical protein
MAERKNKAVATPSPENVGSSESPGIAHPWTDEEMAAAKPLPLPTVGPVVPSGATSVPHVGRGSTKPAGRPEKEKGAS